MRDMPSRHHTHGALTVPLLVIEEQISAEGLQKLGLVQAAQKQGLVQPNIPLTQGTNHPLMGRGTARRHQRSADRTLLIGKLGLNAIECSQERLERATPKGLMG